MGQYLWASQEAAATVPRKAKGTFFLAEASSSLVRPSLDAMWLRRLAGDELLLLLVAVVVLSILGWEKECERERYGKVVVEEEGGRAVIGVWGGVW